jgi:DNA-binding transcriptional regulator YiaG
MSKRYRSKPLAAIHETAQGLREAGVLDKRAMKAFDDMALRAQLKAGTDALDRGEFTEIADADLDSALDDLGGKAR